MNPANIANDLLLRAAEKVRTVATAATPGPWTCRREDLEDLHFGVMKTTCLDAPSRNLFAVASMPAETSQHIALWDPETATAVAEWLEITAKDVGTSSLAHHAAQAVARQILGEDA